MRFRSLSLDDLHIEDERSFRHVALYDELKQALRRDGYRFRVPEGESASWDRVVFLNLTFWDPGEQGDVLASATIPADVVTHVAWHHLARRALVRAGSATSADALFFGEAIASAFDLYLVGRLLGHAPDAQFLETQVPAMAEVAAAAGLDDDRFEALLQEIAGDPERSFEDLRALLFDACTTLVAASSVEEAAAALARFDDHRFGALLHHYELSNWVLFARAHAGSALAPDPAVRAIDAALRASKVSLDWLQREWLSIGPRP
ncbi:Hypothetical protein A7982_06563 [Minicystis rosea]|nr:Hypothetical protein A7982_06563 [Minicystis rosea]